MILSYKKLFKLLIDRNMKQKELARLSGVSIATLTKMKSGKGAINTSVWDRICNALGCCLDDILELVPKK